MAFVEPCALVGVMAFITQFVPNVTGFKRASWNVKGQDEG